MVTLHTGHVAVATILKVECDNAMKTAIRCYDNNKNVANIHGERRGNVRHDHDDNDNDN